MSIFSKQNLLALFIISAFSISAVAQPVVPFRARYTATQKGSLVYVSNNFISCTVGTTSSGISCDSAKNIPPTAATQKDNNSYPAAYIDIDGDPSTFSSSSANLSLPTCSYVTWAGLYWGGDIKQAGPYWASRDSVKLKRPGLASYIPLKADTMITHNVPSHNRMYFAYKNVTAIIQAGGVGTYTCADLRGYPDSTNKTGGWTLIIAYTNDLSNLRNIAVYDGLNIVTNTNQTNLTLSGFQTPVSGPITFECGIISFDGDRKVSGVQADSVLFNDNVGAFNPISNTYNPVNDVHNGTISYNGNNVSTRNPNYVNTMGYDADVFVPINVAKNYLTNNQTSVTLRESTNGEIIPTHVISFAIDVYEPDLRLIKSAVDINGGSTNPGDTIEYTIQALNLGSDTAASIIVTDTIPFNANYIASTLEVTTGPNIGIKTDVAGDDQAEYNAASRFVRIRFGNGATSALGGSIPNIAPNNYNTFKFRVVATTDCGILVCNNVISNQAFASYRGYISGSNQSVLSQPSGTDAFGCPLYGPTNTTITVPPSCPFSLPADTAINDCSLPFYFNSLNPVRPNYTYFNSSFTPVNSTTVNGTFYGIRNNYGIGCRDTFVITFTTTAPTLTSLALIHPTCTIGVNGGRIRANGINGADSMSCVAGPVYTSAPFYRASTMLPVSRAFSNLSEGTYTIRIKNATGCFIDTTVTLAYINCRPIAADDNYSFNPVSYSDAVGSNDDEPDADPSTYSVLSSPLGGTLTFNSDGTFTFLAGLFRGITTFSYLICDNRTPSLCDTGFVTLTVVSPLPVELTTFYGYKNRETNVLNWNTASELNNDYFEIWRSKNDIDYSPLAQVKGSGTSNIIHQYTYNDNAIQQGIKYYYKLKQVDFNSHYSLSKTISIDADKQNSKVELFPNPNKGLFRLKMNCENKGAVTLTVVSQFGSEIYREEFNCAGQSTVKEIMLQNPPKGLYYLIVNGNGNSTQTKFSVQ